MNWFFDQKLTPSSEGASVTWDDARFFTITFEGKRFHGELISDLTEDKQLVLKINQRVFHVRKKHELDELIHRLGMDKPKARKIKSFSAPMPGRVLQTQVAPGDEVEEGTPLLTLEAMKMENTLKSTGSGVVKSVLVVPGQVVEKGCVLIAFE
ncbi:MAG: acetyl-CoA carboxylase biotin carboxyl carrier protein subunit [Flavobacteriales bacterium]|jgi:biotin carboxyl carrier protein